MTLDQIAFEGLDCVRVAGEGGAAILTTSAGPRVLGLTGRGANVMAVLPDAVLEASPGAEPFRLIGGHRLWAAPEVPEVTYRPDERACLATETAGGVRVEAPVDGAGLVKAIEVRWAEGGWIVDHELRNASSRPLVVAPWAITQLRPGGTAMLPLGPRVPGFQADRSLVLWPYTDLADPRIRPEPGAVTIRSTPAGPPVKLGVAPAEGSVSYRLDGEVFEKRTEVDPDAAYADRGAAVQVYLCEAFCELETLGPVRELAPGDRATHRERWNLRWKEGGSP